MKKLLKKFSKKRKYFFIAIDVIIIILIYIFGECFVRDTFQLSKEVAWQIIHTIMLAIVVNEAMIILFDLYNNITRYEGGKDYLEYVLACISSSIIIHLLNKIFNLNLLRFKHSLVLALIISMLMIAYRIIIRMLLNYESTRIVADKNIEKSQKRRVLLIGVCDATKVIVETIKNTMQNMYEIVGIIDDSTEKKGYTISKVKILGNRNDIVKVCNELKVDDIFFSVSNFDVENQKDILNICQQTKTKVRIVPGVNEIIRNKKNIVDTLKSVEINDILGREPIKLDNQNIEELIKDNVILVTGGGGSIGSELCRQIAKYNPQKLIIFDIYENNAYNIQMELQRKYPILQLKVIIGSVRDVGKVENIFKKYKPSLVFHAAAHKHVPLMEVSPLEAIKNNIFGTYNVVNASDKYGVKKFVLISTDKAVNPTNIMGATKRMCEMIIQAKNKVSKTEYAAVRFGNVLGSNGSVVPLFKEQIEQGGPVTVTHKEIIRYFMTIGEAVGLVLQAATYANGGEIFVLDMGEPVKIYDLAVSMIKLSGYEPDKDIKIEITGLRPGEKLYEELLMGEEGLQKTAHEKIFVGEPLNVNMKEIDSKLVELKELINDENTSKNKVKQVIQRAVPTFHEPQEINDKVENRKKEKVQIENKSKNKVKELVKVHV